MLVLVTLGDSRQGPKDPLLRVGILVVMSGLTAIGYYRRG